MSWNFLASSSSDRGLPKAAAVDLDAGLEFLARAGGHAQDGGVGLPDGADVADEALSVERSSAVRRALGEIEDQVAVGTLTLDDSAVRIVGVVEAFGLQPIEPPLLLSPITIDDLASDRNSGGYGGLVLAIMDSLQGAHTPNHQVSTKPRQLQFVVGFGPTLEHGRSFAAASRFSRRCALDRQ